MAETETAGNEARWFVELVERRRVVYEQLLWQVPSASFAGQAFLLNIVLASGASSAGRLVAALFGLGAAVGVLVAYVKHRYTEEIYAEWINGSEERAGRPRVMPQDILTRAYEHREPGAFRWHSHRLRRLTEISAFETWAFLLSLFVLGDLVLVGMSVVEVVGGGTWLR